MLRDSISSAPRVFAFLCISNSSTNIWLLFTFFFLSENPWPPSLPSPTRNTKFSKDIETLLSLPLLLWLHSTDLSSLLSFALSATLLLPPFPVSFLSTYFHPQIQTFSSTTNLCLSICVLSWREVGSGDGIEITLHLSNILTVVPQNSAFFYLFSIQNLILWATETFSVLTVF